MFLARPFIRSYRLTRALHIPSSTPNPNPGFATINNNEISHFSRLSEYWWDEQGEFSFLHMMNPVRVQFIRQKLLEVAREGQSDDGVEAEARGVLSGLDVLDVGCGGGLLSESLARLGARTTGIDASESNIAIATLHASADPKLSPPLPNLTYIHSPAEALLTSQKRYDVVCSMEVLEHVDNPSFFLSTCAQLLKPGGHLFLSTISRTPLAYGLTIFLAENILRKVSSGTHTYSKFIKPSELVEFFQNYRERDSATQKSWIDTYGGSYIPRKQAEVRGLIYNPLQGRWILAGRDTWGATECNYLFWVRKPKL